DVGLKVSLVRADGTAKSIVVLKGSAEAEGQDGREFETVRDDAGVVLGCLLVEPLMVLGAMLGDDDGQVTGGKEECLVTEEPGDPGEGHWATMTAKFRKRLSFCDAIGVPCHIFYLPFAR